VKYGYAAVGLVEQGPAEWVGRRVFVLHPHQTRFVAPISLCARIPDAIPDRRAVLAANMETALNVMWDAAPRLGERAMVIGAGVVGLLCAFLLARIRACRSRRWTATPRGRSSPRRWGPSSSRRRTRPPARS
jgi:hypothetical protein